jgi:nicotinamide-nucleotide amidase
MRLFVKKENYEVKLAFLPSNYEVRLRITVTAKSGVKAKQLIKSVVDLIKKEAVNMFIPQMRAPLKGSWQAVKRKKMTISAAESCTGGLVLSKLTNISGSSKYVMAGVVAYSDEIKKTLLGVKEKTLEKYGAVSEQTAKEMAEGIRKRSKTDIGISTTGIAGPTGALRINPLGLYGQGILIKMFLLQRISFSQRQVKK